jgi:transcriptional regulator with XRE-family HTH domain
VKGKKRRKRLPLFPLAPVLLAKGVTQYRLSKDTGMTYKAINDLHSGKRQPTWENVLRIAKALQVELNAFEPEQYDAREKRPAAKEATAAAG